MVLISISAFVINQFETDTETIFLLLFLLLKNLRKIPIQKNLRELCSRMALFQQALQVPE